VSDPSPADTLAIRMATPVDGMACAAIYGPYVNETAISFEAVPPDFAEMGGRIARTLVRTPWVVVEVDGVVRGYAYAARFRERPAYDWTAETTVYVDRAFHGRGIGRLAMSAVLRILRLQGFHLVLAGVTLPNDGSAALHRALGFRPAGSFDEVGWKDGRWWGVDFFALELSGREAPASIRPLPAIGADELAETLTEVLAGATSEVSTDPAADPAATAADEGASSDT
jgi:phosphinothricin acetyltransferase